ncbi:LacI family DNA-binding transcriptional regulator [Streptomyces sp. FIT100]|uniref:LacI family DNA-binding transcriptional regulator n=1 Tax=Streptomyces sp. FIT100 TaxID=2837956 RepID=UPI0021CA4F6F|nr:LacI family DNA-binding transcriptional regulator [Streptomyces sp. FIT100]UUN26760.1 LacI family transcriptional regulator [Streptomyces sp. FIT100]
MKDDLNNSLVLVLNGLGLGPCLFDIASGIEQQSAAEGIHCVLATTHGIHEREIAVAAEMASQGVGLVALIGSTRDTEDYRTNVAALARELDAAGSRLVLAGRPSPGADLPLTVVDYDNEGGAFSLTSHLLSAGHERILFLGGGEDTTTAARITGYCRAVQAYGYTPDRELVAAPGNCSQLGPNGVRAILRGMPSDVTAVFAWDDELAVCAITQLKADGVPVPEEVSVVGFNNLLPYAEHQRPALTTAHVPFFDVGRHAVKLAAHREEPGLRHAQQVTLGTHVVFRDSVAARVARC